MITPRDADETPPVWTLDIEIAGTVLRYSSTMIEVDGVAYRGGLPSIAVEESLDLLRQEPEVPSVSVSLVIRDPIARWISEGHRIERGRAVLRWQLPGRGLTGSEVVSEGKPLGGGYGAPGEPLSLTIETPAIREGEQLAPGGVYLEGAVAPGALVEESIGLPYPVIFGQPFESRGASLDFGVYFRAMGYASEALRIRKLPDEPHKTGSIAIAAGWLPPSGSVRLRWMDPATPTAEGSVVVPMRLAQRTRDALGNRFTTFDLTVLVTQEYITEDQLAAKRWFVAWVDASGGDVGQRAGGSRTVVRHFTGGPAQDIEIERLEAGSIIEYLWYSVPTPPGGGGAKSYSAELSPRSAGPLVLFSLGTTEVNIGPPQTFSFIPAITLQSAYTLRAKISSGSTSGDLRLGYRVRDPIPPTQRTQTLGGLLLWLAERSGQRTDLTRWAAIASRLDLPVAGVLDGERSAWDILMSEALPLAPVSLATGEGGIYPVLWRWWATPEQAEFAATVGKDGIVRLPDIRSALTDDEVFTEVSLSYAYNTVSGKYARRAVLTADPLKSDGLPELRARRAFSPRSSTLEATISGRIFGSRRYATESKLVYSATMAEWFCRWRLAAEGWTHRVLEIEGRAGLGAYPLGAYGLITDLESGIENAPAFVVGRRRTSNGRSGLRLVLRDSPQATTPLPGPSADLGPPWRLGGPTPQGNPG